MIRHLQHHTVRRTSLVALCALAATAGCHDDLTGMAAGPAAPIGAVHRQALRCTVTAATGDVTCEAAMTPTAGGVAANVIVGGQNTYVRLRSTGAVYDSTRLVMAAPVTVQNLMAQPMGTTDGLTVAAGGVRVFFATQPVTTEGTGQVTLFNPDGVGTFTATGQPYYGYPEIIPSGGISSRRVWKFNLPLTVKKFSFQVFVDTPLPDEAAPLLSGETFSRAPGALTAGLSHGCALRQGAGVFCWGRSEEGQLGVGSPYQLTEVRFPGSFKSVHPGGCGVSTDQWLYCWGNNGNGEVGDGTTTSRLVPVHVGGSMGGLTIASVSEGGFHRCAVTTSGWVYCWGLNFYGQLADGSTTQRLSPRGTNMPASTQVATGQFHTCALTAAGEVYCSGSDAAGQLGDGTVNTGATSSAVRALTPSGMVMTQIALRGSSSCALSSGGAVYCWGTGQPSSDATNRAVPSPVTLPAGVTIARLSTRSFNEVCALSTAGALYCWGASPAVVPTPAGVTFVQVSGDCALAATGAVYCRGDNQFGQLGNGALEASATYVKVNLPAGVEVASVSERCVLTTTGNALCWGVNASGNLGNGTTSYERRWLAPSQVIAPSALALVRTGARASHTCGVTGDGALYCWGANDSTQLGTGDRVQRHYPTRIVLPSGARTVDVSPGMAHTCAATATGGIACWGSNAAGQLGNGTKIASATPVAITLPGGALAARVATGLRHSCALTTTGAAYCWGSNLQSQLGDGTTLERLIPTLVNLPAGVRAAAVSAGSGSTCIVSDSGAAWCWGLNAMGQVGDGTTGGARNVPTAVVLPAGSEVRDLSVGESHACAATASGTAYCWGDNGSGQIGDGVVTSVRPTPIAVTLPEGLKAVRVAAGSAHSCATTTMGIIYCWGANAEGQLGNGGIASMIRMPQAVPLP